MHKKKFLFLFIFISILSAQDSLYLVNTLVGRTQNRLISAKAAGDINGDGYADLAVSFDDSTYIYLGNPDFELKPDYLFPYGFYLNTGDVNNDGYSDYIIYSGQHKFKLHYGGEKLDTTGILIYETKYYNQVYSDQVDPLGDVNGDGYNDFAISSPYNWDNGISYVYLFLGGDSISSQPFVTFEHSPFIDPNSEGTFGDVVTGIGDQNNDGYDDFLISDPGYADTVGAMSSGRVYLYYGGAEINSSSDTILTFNDIEFGSNVKNLGDINNDGSTDFAVTSYDSCIVFFNLNCIMTTRFYGSGHGIGGNADVNKDGIMDLIIGDPSYKENSNFIGRFDIYNGKNNFNFIIDYTNIGEQYGSLFSQYCDFVGDFNGDGYDDIYVVAPTFRKDGKEIGKLYVYSYKQVEVIRETKHTVINDFQLFPNYPNPFNPSTTIQYKINKPGFVQLKIYDMNGKLIKTLVKKGQNRGVYKVVWDAKNDMGINVSTGLYFYRLSFNKKVVSKKMLLIR